MAKVESKKKATSGTKRPAGKTAKAAAPAKAQAPKPSKPVKPANRKGSAAQDHDEKRLGRLKARTAKLHTREESAATKKPAASAKSKAEPPKAAPKASPKPAAQPLLPLTAEMVQIRHRLVSMLATLRKDIDQGVRGASQRDLAHINDSSDMASDAADGDLALRIAESETVEASEIERAIEKLDTGTYGQCEVCNKTINADRLQFLPYVTMCIKCQELAEIRKREQGDDLDELTENLDNDTENN